jgi:hypothetical protein
VISSLRSSSAFAARCLTVAAAIAAVATPLAAQGTAASQGFGYPTGQLGSRASATVGAFTEFDETTPLNPSALFGWRNAGVYFQYEPEFRSTDASGETIRTAVNRVPVVLAALPVGSRMSVALSLSSLLDRTWATDVVDRRLVGAESLYVNEVSSSDGGMNDIRIAGAYRISNWLDIGLGAHAIVGIDRFNQTVVLTRDDPRVTPSTPTTSTSSEFSPYGQSADIRFSGSAYSAGATLRPLHNVAIALSARRGENVRLTRRDSLIANARVPDRVGIGLSYEFVPKTTLAANAEWIGWSSLAALSVRSKPEDALGLSLGIETPGPRFAGRALTMRGGFRHRELAYNAPVGTSAGTTTFEQVRENAISLGLSAPFAYDRASVQIYGQRALRSVAAEKSFIIGVGVSVRP